jgi:hypothetical protein
MRVFTRITAALCAVAIPAAGLAAMAAATASATVRIKVAGVDRNGHVISHQAATLEAASGQSYQVDGNSIRIPTGTYLIGGAVDTGSTSETLVVHQVRIARGGTIKLRAAGGKLVRTALTGVPGPPDSVEVNACLGTQTAAETGVAAGGANIAVYAVPFRSRDVGFSYLATWSRTPAGYAITGSSADGVPASPVYRQRAASLARLTLAVRSGAAPATDDLWFLAPGPGLGSLCAPGGFGGDLTPPFSVTNFVTAGAWTSRVDTGYTDSRGESFDTGISYLTRTLTSRKAYTQTYGAAVAGPTPVQPAINGNLFRFSAADLIDTPGVRGGDVCCVRSTATLSLGPRKLWTAHLNEWRGRTDVQHTVTRAGWYNFDVSAVRWNPHGSEPASLLSPRATLHWHFHIQPVPPASRTVNFPVTVTSYVPRGLSMANQARPGATTAVAFQIVRNGNDGERTHQYPFRSVRILASFDGGVSWQQLTITRHGTSGLATVRDPASGYVALRSVVTDTHGDSTTQTIYRAYAIAG